MELRAIVPELILAGTCLLLVPAAGWARGRWRGAPGVAAVLGFLAALASAARMLPWDPVPTFQGTYTVDGFAVVFKLLIVTGALITAVLLAAYFRGRAQEAQAPVALAFSTLGAVGVTSSTDLGLVILFLQMMSMAAYLLVALERGRQEALEATIKLFIFSAVALAVMAYGLTFLYGLTGSLDFRAIGEALRGADRLWVAFALALILIGYGFEITMVPLHFWSPDVFSGATAPVAGFLAVVPKIAGMAGLLRFLLVAVPGGLAAWPLWIAAGAALTMALGNLVALRQQRLKRLLAYSSIAQAGYVLVAVAAAPRAGGALAAVGYYLAVYLLMNLGAFAVVAHVERAVGDDSLEALRGLGRRAPWAAAAMATCLLSLAGIPPLAGFAGKVFLLREALDGGLTWLAVVAAINFAVALYYYVTVAAEMYLRPESSGVLLPRSAGFVSIYTLTAAGTVALGIVPGPLYRLVESVAELLR